MNDLNTGYSVWNLWSGLNDLTRLQSMATSSEPIDMGIGSLGATSNLQMRPLSFQSRPQTHLQQQQSHLQQPCDGDMDDRQDAERLELHACR